VRARTVAREAALKALYQLDLRPALPFDEVEELLGREAPSADARSYAREIVEGTWRHREPIDREIEAVAQNWDIARMAAIDRNVLRMAIYEMLYREDIPPAVAINEAVTIAKRYSTKDSGGFVNGILDQVKNRKLGDRARASAPAEAEDAAAGEPAETP
jgi:transcription antitermination factor NusB